jgi:acetylornithine deacetylase/succinyl-diaminopimelate desuccinylase-like protein
MEGQVVGRRVTSRPFTGEESYRITKFLADGIGTRVAGTEQEHADAQFIADTFRSMGYYPTTQPFTKPDGAECVNVIASRTKVLPDRYIVVGAHYDSVATTTGANDNASGVGVMVETAVCLAGIETGLPIVFIAFASEEGSHAGSKHFVAALDSPSRVAGMVNLDSVGVDAGLEIGNYGSVDPWFANHCQSVAESLGYTLTDTHFGGKSDYASFADAGIPVACFARTDQSTAHTPDDNMGIITREGMAEIGAILVAALGSV